MVSVSEMARQCGLSRSRFYQLVGTTFPFPVYDVASHRPCYTEELQQVCLDVRRHNCGIDGKAVMFYAKRIGTTPPLKRRRNTAPSKDSGHSDRVDGLRALGLTTTAAQVAAAVKDLFPEGIAKVDCSEVLRAVFLHIKRQNSADNVR
jgi:hypothetical protein